MSRGENVIVHKKMSFLASLVWGICSVVMVTVICSAGIVFYALNVIDGGGQHLIEFLDDAFDDLPAVVQAVPMIGDLLNTERRIDYVDDLDIAVSFTKHPRREDMMRTLVTVENQGSELVSWLSLRVVVMDGQGNLLDDDVEYVATPLALDDDLPGPLLPGSTRKLAMGTFRKADGLNAEYEITEIRVWVDNRDEEDSRQASVR